MSLGRVVTLRIPCRLIRRGGWMVMRHGVRVEIGKQRNAYGVATVNRADRILVVEAE